MNAEKSTAPMPSWTLWTRGGRAGAGGSVSSLDSAGWSLGLQHLPQPHTMLEECKLIRSLPTAIRTLKAKEAVGL